jgi:radical SAM protein with 4Fe4S-binding SPASM domain
VKAEAVGYGAWSAGVHKRARGARLPINVTIEVTHRCPLACAHCYNNLPVGDRAAIGRELSTDEHRRILDELADAGGVWLLFTGGEIFARPDFLDIYKHAKSRGFLVTLFTNGTQITPAIADTLVEWPPFAVEITLYGRTRETYERLTGVPGSFERCMRGIRLLKERGLPVKLKTVAVTINVHEIADMQRFAEEELGVGFKFDGMINARIDCSHSPLDVRLTPSELVQLDLEDPLRYSEWARLANDSPVAKSPSVGGKNPVPDTLYQCGGGLSAFSIDPEGKMNICVLSQRDSYDLRTGSVAEGWNQFLAKTRTKPATRHTKCTDCQIRQLCSTCAATSELEHGDAETPVEYFCEVAHMRALVVGRTPPAHGDCAYCEGGGRHTHLLSEVDAIQRGERRHRPPRRASLTVVHDGAPSPTSSCGSDGGCGSCNG